MRIASWNLEGKWSPGHERVLLDLACDVLLLTEAHADVALPDHHRHGSRACMRPDVRWACVLSRWPIVARPDPHPASVAVQTRGIPVVCSVLPWPLARDVEPWTGRDHSARMKHALDDVSAAVDGAHGIWGGDWNQPLSGSLTGFSRRTHALLLATLESAGFLVPTAALPGRHDRQASIDHVAVPCDWKVLGAGRQVVPGRLSDHDAYWVEVVPRPSGPGAD